MKKQLISIFSWLSVLSLLFPLPVFGIPLNGGEEGGAANQVKFTLTNPGFKDLGPLIGILIQVIIALAGLFFLAQVLIGGLRWIGAGGDPKAVSAARDRITNAVMGLVLVVATYAIILVVEKVLGISILSGINIRQP